MIVLDSYTGITCDRKDAEAGVPRDTAIMVCQAIISCLQYFPRTVSKADNSAPRASSAPP